MQIQNTSGNKSCFEETGRHRSKVKADWIKDGVYDGFDAAANQLNLFGSDFYFDPTESDEGKLLTLTSKQLQHKKAELN